jgi:hypothetical protein
MVSNIKLIIFSQKTQNLKKFFCSILRVFCSNVATSDHAHILHTGVFEGEEFNKKGFMHGSPPVQKLLTISIVNDLI